MKPETAVLHRAPLLLPMALPPIEDGAVLVEQGRITAVAPYAELRGRGALQDHEQCVLMPALVNGHCHLELSWLAGQLTPPEQAGDMVSWIGELLAQRVAQSPDEQGPARQALQAMEAEGVGLVLDIGNSPACAALAAELHIEQLFLLEFLGLAQASAEQAAVAMAETPWPVTGHAPYSTALALLRAIKDKTRQQGSIFSIHLAESSPELELLAHGTGPFRHFLEERAGWDGSFHIPGCTPALYLARHGLLDEQTLCVHCVHLADEEINLLLKHGSHVCLCPGSNSFLGVGKAPLTKMLAAGLLPALGTDSAASNEQLSMWREMRLLSEDHPGVDPGFILAMATRQGAKACGRDRQYGSLLPGMKASFLAVRCPDMAAPLEFLVRDKGGREVLWR